MSPRHSREASYEEAEETKSTPLVRALKERYGGVNTNIPYVDVSGVQGRESPKKSLPPIPGSKSENAFAWRRHRSSPSKESQNDIHQTQNGFPESERSPSPPKRNDFWTTGIPPTIITSPTRGQRPLPLSPYDPRDDLRMPRIDELSLENRSTPSVNVPTINEPADSTPPLNVPTIKVPDTEAGEDEQDVSGAPWPALQIRSKSSPALYCAICDSPISGRIVTAIGHRFHPNCFRCDVCRTELVLRYLP
jgi:hypothetical protein